MPGALHDALAATPNALLANGAQACRDVDDVLRTLDAVAAAKAALLPPASEGQLELTPAARPARSRRTRAQDGGAGAATSAGSGVHPPRGSARASGAWMEELSPPARALCELLLPEARGLLLDEIGQRLALSPSQLASILLPLELGDHVRREAGPRIVLVRR
jgi:predicted Rossmann fold nucleotide-binding protein DprA/Smf involved in DNA uptake